jgi:hypothetical protein
LQWQPAGYVLITTLRVAIIKDGQLCFAMLDSRGGVFVLRTVCDISAVRCLQRKYWILNIGVAGVVVWVKTSASQPS